MTTDPIPTTPLDRPFRALLEGGPAEAGEIVTVRDLATFDGRCVVRSAHREGYWHVPATDVWAANMATVLAATFEPAPTTTFSFPPR